MKYLYNILFLACLSAGVMAQSVNSYFCDFEDEAENKNWVLNGPKDNYEFPNQWYIGTAEAQDGVKSMYISADGGKTATYVKYDNFQIAHRKLTLDAGLYDLAFDWKAGGNSTAYLSVMWVEGNNLKNIWNDKNPDVISSAWVSQCLLGFSDGTITQLYGSSIWMHNSATFTSNGTEGELVFVWITYGNSSINDPAICIDNIDLQRNYCGKPTDLRADVEDNMTHLSWTSTADEFNIKYRKLGETDFVEVDGIKTNQEILNIEFGVYEFQIQVFCNNSWSVWYSYPYTMVYSSKCFNYLDINDENCSWANNTAANYKENVYVAGKLDYGYASAFSYHTIHYMPGEIDSRTIGSVKDSVSMQPVAPLRTIPDGYFASVRINGWQGDPQNARVSRITYDFTVDTTDAAALMLQYAVVLQVPNHSEHEQPRFTLEIVDKATKKTLSTCTDVDFAATTSNAVREGWYFAPADDENAVIWKDWTTVGLNLQDYHQKEVQVILTAYGCTASIHYGYAYFALSCTSGRIEGINCGDTPTTQFIAPEGFNYHWYLASDPNRKLPNNDQRIFPVSYDDTCTYYVDCIYKTNDRCSFTLSASALPRYPIPEATYTHKIENCQHVVSFQNTSHIRTKDIKQNKYTDTTTPPDAIVWSSKEGVFSQTTEWNPVFTFPREGGTYQVNLFASVGLCDSIQVFTLDLPALNDTTVIDSVQACEGDLYIYNGKGLPNDTDIVVNAKNQYGCDSTHIFRLRYVKQIVTVLDEVITDEDSVILGDNVIRQTGYYEQHFTSKAGCDSLVKLTLTVVPKLRLTVSPQSPCSDEKTLVFDYLVSTGVASQCTIIFSDTAKQYGFADTIYSLAADQKQIVLPLPADVPGWWNVKLLFTSVENGDVEIDTDFMVRYASSLLAQRWNDVIGIRIEAEKMSSGEVFTQYQWYKNGQMVDKQTESYFYSDANLNPQDSYAVEIWRVGEQRGVMSCEMNPVIINESDISVVPTSLTQGDRVQIHTTEPSVVQLFSSLGLLWQTWTIDEGTTSLLLTEPQGTYLLRITPQHSKAQSIRVIIH